MESGGANSSSFLATDEDFLGVETASSRFVEVGLVVPLDFGCRVATLLVVWDWFTMGKGGDQFTSFQPQEFRMCYGTDTHRRRITVQLRGIL